MWVLQDVVPGIVRAVVAGDTVAPEDAGEVAKMLYWVL